MIKWIIPSVLAGIFVWRRGYALLDLIIQLIGFGVCATVACLYQRSATWALRHWAGMPAIVAPLVAFLVLLVIFGVVFRWTISRAACPNDVGRGSGLPEHAAGGPGDCGRYGDRSGGPVDDPGPTGASGLFLAGG